MIEFKFDVQLLIEGEDLCEDTTFEYISTKLMGIACLQWGMSLC